MKNFPQHIEKKFFIIIAIFLSCNLFISFFYYFSSGDYQLSREIKSCQVSLEYGYRFLSSKFYLPEKLNKKELYNGTMQGLSKAAHDQYTHFYPARYAGQLNENVNGYSSSIGLVFEQQDKHLQVLYVDPKSPAANFNIKKGDWITAVNHEKINKKTTSLLQNLHGHSFVEITLKRSGEEQEHQLKLPITKMKQHDVVGIKILSNRVLYIAITQFSMISFDDLKSVLQAYDNQADSLILDLRDNPGGALVEAVKMASLFLKEGDVVTDVISRSEQHHTYYAQEVNFQWQKPMIILVNGQSASAAELFSGAIRDHNQALLIGTKTFGKAHVQEVRNLPKGGALRVTTAIYLTPKKKMIHAVGLTPDVKVELTKEQAKKISQIKQMPDFNPDQLLTFDDQLNKALEVITTTRYQELINIKK